MLSRLDNRLIMLSDAVACMRIDAHCAWTDDGGVSYLHKPRAGRKNVFYIFSLDSTRIAPYSIMFVVCVFYCMRARAFSTVWKCSPIFTLI